MTYGDAVAAANAAYDPAGGASKQAGEYCIVHIGTTQGAEDKTSGTSTDGDALIGDNFAAGGLSVAVSTTNCPVGYKKLTHTATVATSPAIDSDAGFVPVKISRFHLTRENAVSTKYQSTHAAAGGAFLKSAYQRTTSQNARGTTRVYTGYYPNPSTVVRASRIGDAGTLQAFLGDNVVLIDSTAGDELYVGSQVLVGTQKNVVTAAQTIAAASTDVEIPLLQLFAGSGENQWSGDEQRDETAYGALNIDPTDLTHTVSLYAFSWILPASPPGSYTYVLECSGRGNCDGTSGVCKCFKGYTNDNCDSQSALFSGK